MVAMRLCALVLAACAVTSSSSVAEPVDEAARMVRRMSDGYEWTFNADHDFGHNHFWIDIADTTRGFAVPRSPGLEGELRATVTWVAPATGQVMVRRFSSVERDGYEPFSEGPLGPGYRAVLVALPHDFGRVEAVVDFWAALPGIPQACPELPPVGEASPCGGATEAFYWNVEPYLDYDLFAQPIELY